MKENETITWCVPLCKYDLPPQQEQRQRENMINGFDALAKKLSEGWQVVHATWTSPPGTYPEMVHLLLERRKGSDDT